MVEVATWVLSVTVSAKKLAEVLNTSCCHLVSKKINGLLSTGFSVLLWTSKEMWDELLCEVQMNFWKSMKPPPPRHLCASLADSGDNAPNHPGADAEIIVGGIQTLIKKRQFFFSAIGSNKLRRTKSVKPYLDSTWYCDVDRILC